MNGASQQQLIRELKLGTKNKNNLPLADKQIKR
jgi:hypothetical protein